MSRKRKFVDSINEYYAEKMTRYSEERELNLVSKIRSARINSRTSFNYGQYFSKAECEEILGWLEDVVKVDYPVDFDGQPNRRQSEKLIELNNKKFSFIDNKKSPICLIKLLKLLSDIETSFNYFSVTMLESLPDCPEQPGHTDSHSAIHSTDLAWNDHCWSILLALEENSTETSIVLYDYTEKKSRKKKADIQIVKTKKEIIYQGGFFMFRDDFPHAGAAYDKNNRRIHIQIAPSKQKDPSEEIGLLVTAEIK
jgi:hypothetical protein